MSVGFLLDKSALARWSHAGVAAVLNPLLGTGQLWTCPIIELEVRYSARDAAEFDQVSRDRAIAYRWAELTEEVGSTALAMQAELAHHSHLRAVGVPDLLIAATAASYDLTVLHYDADFDTLARFVVLGHRWVVPRGTCP